MRTLSEQPGGESIVVYPFLSGAFLIKHDAALALLALRVNAKSTFPTFMPRRGTPCRAQMERRKIQSGILTTWTEL